MATYKKTMVLENKILELEQKVSPKNDHSVNSPVFDITYQSDMKKNGNLSVKCSDVSDTEAKKMIKKLKNKCFSDSDCQSLGKKNQSEVFNVDISNVLKPETSDYKKLLDNLSKKPAEDAFDGEKCELDSDVIRHISESVREGNFDSEAQLSDIRN